MKLLHSARIRPKDRRETNSDKSVVGQPVKFPAPTSGWVENQNIALGTEKTARVMENMFPTQQGVRLRGGALKVATIGARVVSMFTYQTAALSKIFATSDAAIYDISAFNPTTVPSAAVGTLSSGYFSTAQMGTVGGEYLYAVNGTDLARLYDGASWVAVDGASTPAITGVTTSTLSYVWTHKNRFWFVQKNTKTAWYLPVDSIGGAAADFSLDGVFQKGGSLLFGTTWSSDSGSGMDDRAVFVSTEGEVAVYQGDNPASAATWALVGVYSMAKPLGPKCHIRAGGDVLVGTAAGLVPLTAVTQKDASSIDVSSVSAPVEPSWRSNAVKYSPLRPWEVIKWPRENMMLVTLPHDLKTAFVANMQSGGWAKYIGWDMQCGTEFLDAVYFGDSSGSIFAAEQGGSDDGNPYLARLSYMPSDMGQSAGFKNVGALRATFISSSTIQPQLSVTPNYNVIFPTVPPVTDSAGGSGALWDVALWDVALWDDNDVNGVVRPAYSTGWVSVGASGTAVAPQLQIMTGGAGRPDAELVSFEVLFEMGGALG